VAKKGGFRSVCLPPTHAAAELANVPEGAAANNQGRQPQPGQEARPPELFQPEELSH